jgi:hypothetical protein
MFANGIGILTIGVEAHNISYAHALWIAALVTRWGCPSLPRHAVGSRV